MDIETKVEELLADAPDEIRFTFAGAAYRGKPRAKGDVVGPGSLDLRLSRRIGHGSTDRETGEWDLPLHGEALLIEWLTHPRTEWDVTLRDQPLLRNSDSANADFNLNELAELQDELMKWLYPEIYLMLLAGAEGEVEAASAPPIDTEAGDESVTSSGRTSSKASAAAPKA